nr:unnamed protein product [Callosobruchus analis]
MVNDYIVELISILLYLRLRLRLRNNSDFIAAITNFWKRTQRYKKKKHGTRNYWIANCPLEQLFVSRCGQGNMEEAAGVILHSSQLHNAEEVYAQL